MWSCLKRGVPGGRIARPSITITYTALALLTMITWTSAQEPRQTKRVAELADGVRVDWNQRRVEVDGKVTLREGALELFACSPHTREHESIVVVRSRPLRVYEALRLLGIDPGTPVTYDERTRRWRPPTGDRLDIKVRWSADGDIHTVDVGTWMRDAATGKSVGKLEWVFSGSTPAADGAITADDEGTLICVVDFPSAIIAMPKLRSADNDELWVEADPSRIPPIDTPVTLLISPIDPVVFVLKVDSAGDMHFDGRLIAMDRLVERLRRFQRDHRDTAIRIFVDPNAPKSIVRRVEQSVREAVKPGTHVQTVPAAKSPKVDRPPTSGHSERP